MNMIYFSHLGKKWAQSCPRVHVDLTTELVGKARGPVSDNVYILVNGFGHARVILIIIQY